MQFNRSATFVFATLIGSLAFCPDSSIAQDEERLVRQAPVVEEVIARNADAENSVDPSDQAQPFNFSGGKTPQWIWGASEDQNYVLRGTFTCGPGKTHIAASCDNVMTVYLNGTRILSSESWADGARKDISEFVEEGENVLEAVVANQGGPAAFICKVRHVNEDGEGVDYVSGEDWFAAADRDSFAQKQPVKVLGPLGSGPWGNPLAGSSNQLLPDIPRDVFSAPPGFHVERLFDVDKATQGSWVAFTFDPQGRIIASDQGGQGLWRITPAPLEGNGDTVVEKIELPITAAQGLLCAFDSLYLSVNGGPGSGLYRARDTDGDDKYDELKKLMPLRGGGEHGPHALRLAPDGESIFIIAGNHTDLPEQLAHSYVPGTWKEDLLLPRQWDARGHARGKLAPGGWICQVDPEGEQWKVFSIGYRNPYDMDFNADGELFAYDADMEWDMGTSWYRPTRVVHATSGSEFGWRSGTGKWPTYFVDSLPQVVDVGPGSPTGVCFGTGARFPERFQRALFLCDWTFGTIYAVHTDAHDGTYTGKLEEFVSRAPLPLTDVEIGPDGAMYFTIGGRGTQSALYRVTYNGDEVHQPLSLAELAKSPSDPTVVRRNLEALHQRGDNSVQTVESIWPKLSHASRHVRYAARVALEHQPIELWLPLLWETDDPQTMLSVTVAASRQATPEERARLIDNLTLLDVDKLSREQILELLRAYALTMSRLGDETHQERRWIDEHIGEMFPTGDDDIDRELSRVLVAINSPRVIEPSLALMEQYNEVRKSKIPELLSRNQGYGSTIANMLANSADPRSIHYALVLRNMKYGWTLEQRRKYFEILDELSQRSGGASYQGFIANIRKDALNNCLPAELAALESELATEPPQPETLPTPSGPGRAWTVTDVAKLGENALKSRDFENGHKMYLAAKCANCHRFGGAGGSTGPDLTNVAGRFGVNDLAEALIEPSKIISDQYGAHLIATADGEVILGRILAETEDGYDVLVDPEDINAVRHFKDSDIEELTPSAQSLMPEKLLDELNDEEVLDLIAYLLSRGNPNDPMFAREE